MSLSSGFTGGSRETKKKEKKKKKKRRRKTNKKRESQKGFSLVIGPICMGTMDEKGQEEGWPKIPEICIDLSTNKKRKIPEEISE